MHLFTLIDLLAARAAHSRRRALVGYALLLLAVLLPWAARAQAPTWQDAFNNGGPVVSIAGTSSARATATDASGNVYVTGSFTRQVAFGSTVLTISSSSSDVFVAKWDAAARVWAWAVAGGGSSADVGYGIAVDGSGNVYVTGSVTNAATSATDPTSRLSVQFGGIGLPSAGTTTGGNLDVFVASYTTAGAYRWATAAGGTNADVGYGVAVDPSGNVFVTGSVFNAATSATDQTSSLTSRVQFSGIGLPSASTNINSNQDVFVASYSAAGAYRWAVAGGGTSADVGNAIAVDLSGNAYVTGSVTNAATSATDPTSRLSVQFGGVSLPSASTTNTNQDVFVASYSAAGAYRWATAGGGTSNDVGYGVAVDPSGNVYVTGSVNTLATTATDQTSATGVQFGGVALPSATPNTGGNLDVFVASYTTAGAYRWAVAGGGGGADVGYGIAADPSGNVYVTGSVTNAATSATDPTSSPSYRVQFGGVSLPSANTSTGNSGNLDVFVASYTTAGAYRWATAGGGTGADAGYDIAVTGSGTVAVAAATGNAFPYFSTLAAPTNAAVLGQLATSGGAWQRADAPLQLLPGTSVARATATDASGNVYVTGSFASQMAFGSTLLTSAGGSDVFVAKWDVAARAWAWATAAGGTGADVGNAIAVDPSGNVFVTGSVTNAATTATDLTSNISSRVQFGGVSLPSASPSTGTGGNLDVFVASYTTAGAYRWATAGGGTNADVGYGLALDGSGNVYVTGSVFNGATSPTNQASSLTYRVQFGGVSLPSASPNTGGSLDAFVASYSAAGDYRWAESDGGTGADVGFGVAVDGTGNVYVTGAVTNAVISATNLSSGTVVQFGGIDLLSASTSIAGNTDAFVASYSAAAGAYRWATAGGGTGADVGNAIAVDPSGNVFVTGSVTNAATSATDQTSNTSSRVQFGGTGLPSAGTNINTNTDVFLASYSAAGAYRWATAGGGTGNDVGNGVALDPSGNVNVTGAVTNAAINTMNLTSAFEVQFGGTGLPSASASSIPNTDVFVASYTAAAGAYRWATAGGGTGNDIGYGVAVDPSGNVNVTGQAVPAATFGSTPVATPVGVTSFFVARLVQPTPKLTAVAPNPGGLGQSITLTGLLLSNPTALTINGANALANIISNTGTSLVVRVPVTAAATGNVSITTANGTATAPFALMAPPGNALAFDGVDDYVRFGAMPAVSNLGPGSFTLEAWVYYTGGTGPQSIIRKTGDYNLYLNGNTLHAEVWPNGAGTSAWRIANGTAVLPANRWMHVAAVWNTTAGTFQLYVNGVADGPGTTTAGAVGGSENLTLGQSSIYGNPLAGRLDEVRIYTTALTAAQLRADMVSTTAAVPASLAFYCNFDQGTPATASAGNNTGLTTLYDLATGTPGTLTNFALAGGNTASNYVESYAMVLPVATTSTDRSATGFTAAWTAPVLGTVTSYLLDVSTTADFAAPIPGSPFAVAAPATSYALTGLNATSAYYYRVRALNSALAEPDQGAYSNTVGQSTPLPVELTAFTARQQGTAVVRLAWATASEKNSTHFDVERSADGRTFVRIGTVPAAGSSQAPRTYALPDVSLPTGAAVLYYRLKQVDADGTFHYSSVRVVALTRTTVLGLYPNPAHNQTTLTGAAPNAVVAVYDALGRPMLSATADAAGTALLSLPAGLPAGVYVVRAGGTARRLTVE